MQRCAVCDEPAEPFGELICSRCRAIPEPVGDDVCEKCGKPLARGRKLICADCARTGRSFDRGAAVFYYRSVSGGMFRFKYQGRAEYAEWYGQMMAEKILCGRGGAVRKLRQSELLIPVPVSAGKLLERGYNQAALLARRVSELTGIPVREDILERGSDTKPMKYMSAAQRRQNLKKALIVYGNDVKSKVIMLIDDIYTTGATMDACAGVLKEAGAREVHFLTLAIGADAPVDRQKTAQEDY